MSWLCKTRPCRCRHWRDFPSLKTPTMQPARASACSERELTILFKPIWLEHNWRPRGLCLHRTFGCTKNFAMRFGVGVGQGRRSPLVFSALAFVRFRLNFVRFYGAGSSWLQIWIPCKAAQSCILRVFPWVLSQGSRDVSAMLDWTGLPVTATY